LQRLADEKTNERLLVVLTTSRLNGRLVPSDDEIQMKLLSVADLGQLLDAHGLNVDAATIHELTGGVPQLVDNLVTVLRDDPLARELAVVNVPAVRAIAVERVARCGAHVASFLKLAVSIGPRFDLILAARLAGIDPEDAVRRAEAALDAGILRSVGSQFEFRNPAVAQALHDAVPAPVHTCRRRRAAALGAACAVVR
jgi:hypothetical protein